MRHVLIVVCLLAFAGSAGAQECVTCWNKGCDENLKSYLPLCKAGKTAKGEPKAAPAPKAKKAPPACRDAVTCLTECDDGVARSCITLGGMYENGLTVKQSGEQAESFFKKACDLGDSKGCDKLKPYQEKAAQNAAAAAAKEQADADAKAAAEHKSECRDECVSSRAACDKDVSKDYRECLQDARRECESTNSSGEKLCGVEANEDPHCEQVRQGHDDCKEKLGTCLSSCR